MPGSAQELGDKNINRLRCNRPQIQELEKLLPGSDVMYSLHSFLHTLDLAITGTPIQAVRLVHDLQIHTVGNGAFRLKLSDELQCQSFEL